MDRSLRIPGTSIRFGLDPILGLLPVGGDIVSALGAGYILFVAWRNGAPGGLIARMLVNVVLDTLAGSVPVLGDLFDAGWKANTRNVGLLEGWLRESGGADPPNRLMLVGIGAVLAMLVTGLGLALWWAVGLVL
jgi:hypothetical protein